MKKLIFGLLLLCFFVYAKPAYATSYPDPSAPTCVENEVSIVDNQRFSLGIIAYRWHISSQTSTTVTYRLQWDIDPRGGRERWENTNVYRTVDKPICEQPVVDVCPNLEGVQESLPEGYRYDEEKQCVPVEEEPQEPETPFPQPQLGITHQAPPGPPVCWTTPVTKLVDNALALRNGDTAELRWWPSQGDRVHIYYKDPTAGSWQHAVRDLPNNGSFTIRGLETKDWSFGIQQANECSAGPTAVIIDGNEPKMFTMSYWTW